MTSLQLFQHGGSGPRIVLIAGEASGDLLAGALLAELRRRWPDAQLAGIGGRRMLEQGFESVVPMDWLAVNGYVEVLKRLPKLLALRRELIRAIVRETPDLVIGIDAPDFNLELERQVKQSGIRTLHYVSPSVWAWRGERVHKVKAAADHVLCLFPMEPPLYTAIGMPATFVGHPLADAIALDDQQARARATLGLSMDTPVFALLPGSRQGEVAKLAPVLLQAAQRIRAALPEARFVMPLATAETRALFAKIRAQVANELPLIELDGQAQLAMAAADLVVVASGTATLEAALLKKPMVIVYQLNALTAWLMKRKAYLPWVGLPNILCHEALVPELLQDAANPQTLAETALALFHDPQRRAAMAQRFTELHVSLKQNAAVRAADVVANLMNKAS